ncbi:hypothetical protein SAMN06265365_123101 [Tistlia consotensis]|uniref:Uncharacterized protein n=1 Tax=Tistlia consotensis USBA 355 TaxID=560819 RepID=A0A1Y6CM15_9PROT|nr:hypothetical protein [Tistlia consotensis]SMF63874.1 hypothetical protein SAMN05428998_1258 [Tistlia consotensis USBA 355]SNR98321.1 hypothetical protein SAMN06265365_123101 [Tistlia consotensis]
MGGRPHGRGRTAERRVGDIEFDAGEGQCHRDLKAVYNDGTEAVWTDIDLCALHKITLYYNSSDDTTRAVGE